MRGDRRLAAGTRLPSTRNLAAELMVSRRGEAYEQLSAEGWLLARRGAGTPSGQQPALGGSAHPTGPAARTTARTGGDRGPGGGAAAAYRPGRLPEPGQGRPDRPGPAVRHHRRRAGIRFARHRTAGARRDDGRHRGSAEWCWPRTAVTSCSIGPGVPAG
ncbi:GntR family transcriptional regulator [Micromonospora sp. LOL_028]|uniref:GntR family transcriptional regulator n=1 Tax=Micromonospora sp. LOL_028 TaxID=3345420 RepID=UPI003A895160